jgi:hypothetical protein
MPFSVALVAFLVLPVLFVISTGIMAFSITITALTTTLTTLLCKGGALRLCHSCDHSFAKLVQKMQSLLAILGITIVSGGEVILQIHLEVAMLRSTLTKRRNMRRIAPRHHLSQTALPWLLGRQLHGCTILGPHIPTGPCAGESPRWLHQH